MSTFDVRRVYSSCELFKNCSAEFVRSLLDEGGEEARQGAMYDPSVVTHVITYIRTYATVRTYVSSMNTISDGIKPCRNSK